MRTHIGSTVVAQPRRSSLRGQPSRGFTLIELMIVVVVVSILLAVAVPAYNEQVRRTRRSTATATLLEAAQALERFNTVNGTYIAVAPATNALCNRTLDFYSVSCTALTATTFTLSAAPSNAQTGDRCGSFTYTQAGVEGLTGQQAGLTAADCW